MQNPGAWTVVAVALGSAAGAVLRWQVGLWLNARWAGFPLGTLLVNCAGGLLIGGLVFWLARQPNELLRLLLVTGFLGGMTTFSSFSAESLALLQQGQWAMALGHTLAHVLGALVCTALGYLLARQLLG